MEDPIRWMRHARTLAAGARLHAPPNPWVGCVIVKGNSIIGEGCTQPPGQPHAEIKALRQATGHTQGATLYVTLEPCPHTGKTPPCTEAIIRSGIREVYVGIEDPDPHVQGKGLTTLRNAGIQVIQGICWQEIEEDLAPYLHQRRSHLPYTILKAAISLDGRIAAVDGTSQWITGTEARQDVHLQRARSQAIVIGSGTALRDFPRLTVRYPHDEENRQPLRVLLDARGRVPARGALFDRSLAPTLVFTTDQCSEERQSEWRTSGAEVILVPLSSSGLDLPTTWRTLGERGLLQVLVEGGATLHTALLHTSLVNRLLIYMGPLLLGASGYPLYTDSIATLEEAKRFSLREVTRLGECVRLDYS